jgi:hypothetical protein
MVNSFGQVQSHARGLMRPKIRATALRAPTNPNMFMDRCFNEIEHHFDVSFGRADDARGR